jgi:hypothetical protein
VNGGNLTDLRLTGAGVTAANFGPVAAGADSGDLPVTFHATSGGPLTGQQVRIVNNFDNVTEQTLQITGAAYRYANPTPHTPEPVNFGIVHVGDAVQQALSITNNAPNDGYSERLNASIGNATGGATTNSGSFTALLPGSTNNTILVVGVSTATAGAKTGTATISLTSTGAGTSGLADTPLADQTVNVQAQVNNFAAANIVKLAGNGALVMNGANDFTLNLGSSALGLPALSAELGVANTAAAPADDLAGSFTTAAPSFSLSGFGPFSGVAAGSTQSGLLVGLNSSTAGSYSGQITLQPQSTNAQPFSANLPLVTIHLVGEVKLSGDYNNDNTVNAADYTLWRNNRGLSVTLPNDVTPGDVSMADYFVWKTYYGQTRGSGAGSGASATVPEPSAIFLALAGAWVAAWRWRLRRNCSKKV